MQFKFFPQWTDLRKYANKRGIKIIFIPNSFVKNYEYIIDIIISSKNAEIPIQQTIFDSI